MEILGEKVVENGTKLILPCTIIEKGSVIELGFTVNKNDETMVISNLAND